VVVSFPLAEQSENFDYTNTPMIVIRMILVRQLQAMDESESPFYYQISCRKRLKRNVTRRGLEDAN